MSSRPRWMVPGIVLAAAAAGFLVLRAGPEAPSRGGPVPVPAPTAADTARVPPGLATTAKASSTPDVEANVGDDDSGEARHLAERMAKLVRDLEYTPGLPEPVQQAVRPQPEPWRSDPGREGPSPIVEEVTPHRIRTTGGDRVTIRGKNLRVVQVMFGAAPGRLLEASGNEVAVEAPPSEAGPVTIAVTNDDGTWAIAAAPIDYE